jgi:putative transposase
MSTRYKFWEQYASYFVTYAVVDWVDVFTRNEYRRMVVDSILHCVANKGLVVHGWVLMSNHVHLLISLEQGSVATLSDIMRDMKKYTAMQLIKCIKENPQESRKEWMMAIFEKAGKLNSNNTNYQFWRQDNHPLILNDDGKYGKALEYIHQNPVTAGLVDDAIAYPWSSAKDYAGGKGMIPITML